MLEYFHRPRWERYLNYVRMELMYPRLGDELDKDYYQYDTDRAFCLSHTPAEPVTPAEDHAYVPELLAVCEKLLDQQVIEVPGEQQENTMECH